MPEQSSAFEPPGWTGLSRWGRRAREELEVELFFVPVSYTHLAYFFHLEMWVYVHGIAAMIATDYLDWDEELISRMLTDAYEGMKERYKK